LRTKRIPPTIKATTVAESTVRVAPGPMSKSSFRMRGRVGPIGVPFSLCCLLKVPPFRTNSQYESPVPHVHIHEVKIREGGDQIFGVDLHLQHLAAVLLAQIIIGANPGERCVELFLNRIDGEAGEEG